MALFKKLARPDAGETQLSYKIKFWPEYMLGQSAKKLFKGNLIRTMTKEEFESHLDETQTYFFQYGESWKIVWAYNNIPTEIEWRSKSPDHLLRIEFRQFIHQANEQVVIISFREPLTFRSKPKKLFPLPPAPQH